VNENESLERAAARELQEETGLTGVRLEQIGAFGDPGRDPRGHTITVAFVTYRATETAITPGDDAIEAEWHPLRALDLGDVSVQRSVPPPPPGAPKKTARRAPAQIRLAFDHATIVTRAYRRLCRHLADPTTDPAFDVMPPRFTLAELRRIYEVVIGRKLTPRVIRGHLLDRGLIVPATTKPTAKAAAQLYRWNRR
jgi:8-oxo-dGTP diphosphatase